MLEARSLRATMKSRQMATPLSNVGLDWRPGVRSRSIARHQHEDKVLLVLTLIIGAVVGLAVVLFIVLTETLGARLYPPASPAWRRVLIPVTGALITGFLLKRYFP